MSHYFKNCLPVICILFSYGSFAQITYHDGSVHYEIVTEGDKTAALFKDATFKVYIRGPQSKTELLTPFGKTITYFDEKTGQAIQLNEYGNQRLMVKMTEAEYRELNRQNETVSTEKMTDQKSIAGFNCLRVNIVFKDGKSMLIYYSPDLVFQSSFNAIPVKLSGFPLEYESAIGGMKVTYRAKHVSTRTVPAALFDIDANDYKEINYQDLKNPAKN